MSIAKTTRPYLLTREAAAARIEALEAECDRWAEQANTTAASLRTKVKTLEAALREITAETLDVKISRIARAALAPEQEK